MSKEKKEEKCDCKHEVHFVVTIGDGCMHIVPHPTKKDEKEIISSLEELIENLRAK